MELHANVEEIRQQGAEVWVVSPDQPEKLEALRREQGLGFPVLVDGGNEVAGRYGIVNEAHPQVPHPTALVIDREGVIRYLRVDEDYKVRPPAAELVGALEGLGE